MHAQYSPASPSTMTWDANYSTIGKQDLIKILTDRRSSDILPSKEKVATHWTDHDDSTMEYNNHSISLSNMDTYEILDHISFHYYPH